MKQATKSKQAQSLFKKNSEDDRNQAILAIATAIESKALNIIEANKADLIYAKEQKMTDAVIDRLKLDTDRIKGIIQSVKAVANQAQVVNIKEIFLEREDGLKIFKQSIPLGVIGMIFESRPNVVIDGAVLAIKSGNCIILKGGSDARNSNLILSQIIRDAIKNIIPEDVVQLIDSRDQVSELLEQVDKVDLIIPRGGERLIKYIYENSKVPVIAHFRGLCHLYIDKSANLDQAIDIVLNAKTQRTGVCNAIETLLLHKDLPASFTQKLLTSLEEKETELRVSSDLLTNKYKLANDVDWNTEYLDNILSIKTVKGCDEAIEHIEKYGSHHTEAILAEDEKTIEQFTSQVDASSIMVNASTRFNDGGEFGLGAEIGISTTKLHAYGPMGAKELTTHRYLVMGSGHIRK